MSNTEFTLALEFDVNQITRSLQFKFISNDGSPDIPTGPLAGTAHFNEGNQIGISVTATGRSQDNISFRVTDCTLVSLGTANLGKFFLSPFSEEKATEAITQWSPTDNITTPQDQENQRTRLISYSEDTLLVAAPTGQWEISGYLSVAIEIDGTVYHRVFYFDPEGTTGNGGGLNFP